MKLFETEIFLMDDREVAYLVAKTVFVATSVKDRRQGLIGMESLPPFWAMLIYPCNRIHMRGVKFPIDVVYLNQELRVVRVVKQIQPGAVDIGHKEAFYTLELPAGTIGFEPKQMRLYHKL